MPVAGSKNCFSGREARCRGATMSDIDPDPSYVCMKAMRNGEPGGAAAERVRTDGCSIALHQRERNTSRRHPPKGGKYP